ncbi:ankyrin repeat domain-containing protein [Candidatus Micrarchaeota archaeon]|nr:ankyrin repeat domain-containing protein [Candidatus Micrarchaeota archaeon]
MALITKTPEKKGKTGIVKADGPLGGLDRKLLPPDTLSKLQLNKELLEAAEKGDTGKVADLLKMGADPNAKDKYGVSALSYAAYERHVEITRLLLENGADPDSKSKLEISPLFGAVGEGYLRKYSNYSREIVELLISKGAEVNGVNTNLGLTALMFAEYGASEILIAHGADVNAKDAFGDSVLVHAKRRGRDDIVGLLEKHGARE